MNWVEWWLSRLDKGQEGVLGKGTGWAKTRKVLLDLGFKRVLVRAGNGLPRLSELQYEVFFNKTNQATWSQDSAPCTRTPQVVAKHLPAWLWTLAQRKYSLLYLLHQEWVLFPVCVLRRVLFL